VFERRNNPSGSGPNFSHSFVDQRSEKFGPLARFMARLCLENGRLRRFKKAVSDDAHLRAITHNQIVSFEF
jgi:hypothetical protein